MKGRSRPRALLLAIPLTAVALSFSGCAADGASQPLVPTAPAHTASSSPSAPATPAEIEGDTDHTGRLSEFEKQILAQNAVHDYTMPDGSVVKIDPQKPLLAAVNKLLAEQAAPIAGEFTSEVASVAMPAIEDMRAFAWSKAEEVGKPLVVIWPGASAIAGEPGASETIWRSVPSGVKSTGLEGEHTKEAMLASVKQWADPRGYEVIVAG